MATRSGFNLFLERKHSQDTDWKFGSSSQKCRAQIPVEERLNYLPDGELQYGRADFEDCASRAPINILELKFNYLVAKGLLTDAEMQWLTEKKYLKKGKVTFSDRFISIKSGTTRQGNSLKAPVDAIHRYGLIPKVMLPAKSSMNWWDYNNPAAITAEMEALGLEFLQRFPINYEKTFAADLPSVMRVEPVGVAGFAWPVAVDGIYPRTEAAINHCFVYFILPQYTIFDNYRDSVDGDFIKRLAPDYILMEYGYRVYIGTSLVEYPESLVSDGILAWLKELLRQNRGMEVLRYLAQRFGSIFTP